MKYNIFEYVDLEANFSNYNVEELVFMCKRVKNTKRDYLFINKYQAKHIPSENHKSIKLYNQFFDEIMKNLQKYNKILVVGFAETATSLAGYISYRLDKISKLGMHMQTTRENLQKPKIIDFLEEHSHAKEQFLYSEHKFEEYDYLLFVEDEITTGKTIINFKKEFDKIIPIKYGVASILNWQNNENREKFKNEDIDRIFLISGAMKGETPLMDVELNKEIEVDDLSDFETVKIKTQVGDLRTGALGGDFFVKIDKEVENILNVLEKYIKDDDVLEIIGTEEYMFVPFMVANQVKNLTYTRATTRTPITASNECIVEDFIKTPSVYDEKRETFLYNISQKVTKTIVITDRDVRDDFVECMRKVADFKNSELLILVMG